jgi:hypothetical protein
VVVPSKPEESLLIKAVQQTGDLKMPPKEKLKDQEVAELVRWIRSGANWPAGGATVQVPKGEFHFTSGQKAFWAFQPVKAVTPPATKQSWGQSPLDRFILAKLEAAGLSPAPAADKRTLLRRTTFDLTGLPPTPQELDAFLADNSPDAFACVVDRLLGSPHYGERWARHWLDLVRYADTTANDANAVMRYAWRYRDYVAAAFNKDKPYDHFIIEQLAGDLLAPLAPGGGEAPGVRGKGSEAERIIATGFLMIGSKALAETDKEQSRIDIVDDQLDVTGRAFLGLTLGCARCHDHKFDPIPTLDYYSLAGIFRSTEVFRDEVRNASMWQEWPLPAAKGEKPTIVMAPKEGKPADLRVHKRGNRLTLGAVAPRRFLQILAGENHTPLSTRQSGRLELAHWIASKDNPLTARVMVNRLWQHHFGTGLVATSDNFGTRGEKPSHAELLDWLAAQFIDSGWSVKTMHRLMLLSRTYQMSSTPSEQGLRIDPGNRLLWRMPRRRLDAESLRDSFLAISGRLDRTIGGDEASEFLYKEGEVIDRKRDFFRPSQLKADNPYYTNSVKRSLYLPVVRNALPDVLALFDAADPNGVTTIRNDTTVPSQALFLLNHPIVREQSLHFARSLLADPGAKDEERVNSAFSQALSRAPTAAETQDAVAFLHEYTSRARSKGRSENDSRLAAWQSYCQMLFCSNEFLYVE